MVCPGAAQLEAVVTGSGEQRKHGARLHNAATHIEREKGLLRTNLTYM